jgi:short-subunit dehydrogenase
MRDPIQKAIVVGASSGIGAALARRIAAGGGSVALVARRGDMLSQVANSLDQTSGSRAIVVPHDVTRRDEIPGLFQECTRRLEGLDTIIYAAGVLPTVGPEEYNTEKDASMIEVNTLGAIAWLNEAALRFDALGSGRIVGISSIAGDRGRRVNPVYCTSKAAMNTYLEALRNRLAVKGVQVSTIKPGFVETEMVAGKGGLLWMISPDVAADTIVRRVERGTEVFYLPSRWRIVGTIVRALPSFLFRRINI